MALLCIFFLLSQFIFASPIKRVVSVDGSVESVQDFFGSQIKNQTISLVELRARTTLKEEAHMTVAGPSREKREFSPFPLAPGCDKWCVGIVAHHKLMFLVDSNAIRNDPLPMLENYGALREVCTDRGGELIHLKSAEQLRKRIYPFVKATGYEQESGIRGGIPLVYEFQPPSMIDGDTDSNYVTLDVASGGGGADQVLTGSTSFVESLTKPLQESKSVFYPVWAMPAMTPDNLGHDKTRKRCMGIGGGGASLSVFQCLKPGLAEAGVGIHAVLCEATRMPVMSLPADRGCDQRCGSSVKYATPTKEVMYFLVNRNIGVKCQSCQQSEDLYDDQGTEVTSIGQMRQICLRRGGDIVNVSSAEMIEKALYPMLVPGGSSPAFDFNKKGGIPLGVKSDIRQAHYNALDDDSQNINKYIQDLSSSWTKPCSFRDDSSTCQQSSEGESMGLERCIGFGCNESTCVQGYGLLSWDCEGRKDAKNELFRTTGVLCERKKLTCDMRCVASINIPGGRRIFIVDNDSNPDNPVQFTDVHGVDTEILTYMQLRIQCMERGGDLVHVDSPALLKNHILPLLLASGYDGSSEYGVIVSFDAQGNNEFGSLKNGHKVNAIFDTLQTEDGWGIKNINEPKNVNYQRCAGIKFNDSDEPSLASWMCTFDPTMKEKAKMEPWTRAILCEA
eukprot:GHVL01003512.1.p1 GENE.GHVL01003512.1~~GHVL01003512.1.p1  ORF type:complete len:675 (+),score=111.57 GHVL01003512.1:178-2202(+)